uniref:Hypotheticial protein n=1 Tax=Schistosoma japonicum TaxID=6182 RepID=C1L4Y4_SCHJA|nr:hypotheticial protein [Schistosoma japonicum]
MKFFTLYLTLIYTILGVYSIPGPYLGNEQSINLGKNDNQEHRKHKSATTPVHTMFHENVVNVSKRPEHSMPKYEVLWTEELRPDIDKFHYDDTFRDFPRQKLREEENPFNQILNILQSETVLPLWIVSPIYYLQETLSRFLLYLISRMW